MKYAVITGDHPRHLAFLHFISTVVEVDAVFIEKREAMSPPEGEVNKDALSLNDKHFANRLNKELEYFGQYESMSEGLSNIYSFSGEEGFSDQMCGALQKIKPDVVFSFGTLAVAKIIQPRFSGVIDFINLNTGLVQKYNGDATLFWPFYFLEPNWAGGTFHFVNDKPEEHSVIHQFVPELEYGDTIHDVGCKVVACVEPEIKKLLQVLESGGELVEHRFNQSPNTYSLTDFKVAHLVVIYELFDDKIVDRYLDGDFGSTPVNLHQAI